MGEPNPYVSTDVLSGEAQEQLKGMKRPLLLALINRLGDSLTMPIEEINAADDFILVVGGDAEAQIFTFRVVRKER